MVREWAVEDEPDAVRVTLTAHTDDKEVTSTERRGGAERLYPNRWHRPLCLNWGQFRALRLFGALRHLRGHTDASRCNFIRFIVLLHSAAGEPDG